MLEISTLSKVDLFVTCMGVLVLQEANAHHHPQHHRSAPALPHNLWVMKIDQSLLSRSVILPLNSFSGGVRYVKIGHIIPLELHEYLDHVKVSEKCVSRIQLRMI